MYYANSQQLLANVVEAPLSINQYDDRIRKADERFLINIFKLIIWYLKNRNHSTEKYVKSILL